MPTLAPPVSTYEPRPVSTAPASTRLDDRSPERSTSGWAKAGALATAGLLTLSGLVIAELDNGPTAVDVAPHVTMADVASAVGADDLWALGYDGSGVAVAVIDTGVSPVDGLAQRIVSAVDLSADGRSNSAGIDGVGHGTHLAGIIAGSVTANDTEFAGVAPGADLVAIKVADESGRVSTEEAIAGVDWVVAHAAEHNIRVITLALDTGSDEHYATSPLAAALERAWDAGIVVVTGAGNSGTTGRGLTLPASDPLIITVGAMNSAPGSDLIPSWATAGNADRSPDLVAPGAHISSLVAPGSDADLNHPEGRVNDSLIKGSGSSQSAAVVAGAVALLLEARPELNPDDVKATLVAAARPVDAPRSVAGAGALDVSAALETVVMETAQDDVIRANPPVSRTMGDSFQARAGNSWAGNSWIGNSWIGNSWIGNSWIGNSWIGNSWIGNSWIGNSWIGNGWIGNSWIGNSWIGNSWIGNSWIGNSWIGNSWIGNSWIGNSWIGNSWIGNSWIGNSWIGNSWI